MAKIESLVQDIVYVTTNGKHRTSKHVLLSLCVKRKTGSKDVITWLNRSGHGVSMTRYLCFFIKLLKILLLDKNIRCSFT